MARRKEVQIGEHMFYIARYEPFLALEVLGDLQKQFAGPFLAALDGKPSENEGARTQAMMVAFANLSGQMDGKTLRELARKLINQDYVSVALEGGQKVEKLSIAMQTQAFESVSDIIQLCWEIIQHNFAEVIARLSSPTGPARALMGSRSANSAQSSSGN